MRAVPRKPPIIVPEISKAAIRPFTSIYIMTG
jgi:hypothetical protein